MLSIILGFHLVPPTPTTTMFNCWFQGMISRTTIPKLGRIRPFLYKRGRERCVTLGGCTGGAATSSSGTPNPFSQTSHRPIDQTCMCIASQNTMGRTHCQTPISLKTGRTEMLWTLLLLSRTPSGSPPIYQSSLKQRRQWRWGQRRRGQSGMWNGSLVPRPLSWPFTLFSPARKTLVTFVWCVS